MLWTGSAHCQRQVALFYFIFSSDQGLLRNYEADIEQLNKQQKIQVEKAEVAQGVDMKVASKKIRADQVSIGGSGWIFFGGGQGFKKLGQVFLGGGGVQKLDKQQKIQVEKAEVAQGVDMKLASKKIRADQVCGMEMSLVLQKYVKL